MHDEIPDLRALAAALSECVSSDYWQTVATVTTFLVMLGAVCAFLGGLTNASTDGDWWGWALLLISPVAFVLTFSHLATLGGAA